MLNYEIWGNSVQTWIVSLLIIAGAFIVVKLLSLLGRKVIKPFIGRTSNRVDDIIYYSLESPLKFAVMLLGIWIAIHRLVYPDHLVKYVDNAYSILIILDITWVLARLSTALLQQYWGQRSDGHALKMMPVVRRTILVLIWIVGLVTALSNVGVDINALWGTLGIGGIAISLGFQDTLSNLIGGLQVSLTGLVEPGDNIEVGGERGIVQDVTWRHTTIENSVGERVVIPNSIINKTALVKLRPLSVVTIPVVVTVDGGKLTETAESMRTAADKAASGVCALEKEARVLFSEVTDYGYRGTLTFTVVDAAEAATAKDAVLRAIAPLVHTEQTA